MDHLLNYNGKNVFSIHYNPDFDQKTKKCSSINNQKTKRFMPGNNIVSSSEWEMIKTNPSIPFLFDAGTLSWVGDSPDQEKTKGFNFSSLSASEAGKVVEQTFDVQLLETWKATDNRPAVLKKITEKIDKIMSYEPVKGAAK